MANHQYDLADRNFRRSLELDPGNRNATKKLKELQLLAEPTPPRSVRS